MPAEAEARSERSRRRPAVVAVVVGVALVAAVAVAVVLIVRGDDHVLGEIDRAFAQPIGSAQVRLDAELRVDGSPQLSTPLRLRVAGPYRDGGARTIPVLDWNALLTGAGRTLSMRLISTGDNAFVVFQGVAYEVGAVSVADLNRQIAAGGPAAARAPTLQSIGLVPSRWLVEPDDRGEETVGGVTTEHYAANIDAARLVGALQAAVARAAPRVGRPPPPPLTDFQRRALRSVFAAAELDVYVGEEDGRIRQLVVRAPFTVPPQSRAQAGGATGGLLYVSLGFSRIGEPVRVAAPPAPRPIDELRRQIGPPGTPGL